MILLICASIKWGVILRAQLATFGWLAGFLVGLYVESGGNALSDEWKKQTVTRGSDLVYSDDEGNAIAYRACIATYYEADPTGQTSLNADASAAVIDPDETEICRECTVSGLPAAIYQKDGRAYLCWTIMPELGCVMEYDPAVEREEDMRT